MRRSSARYSAMNQNAELIAAPAWVNVLTVKPPDPSTPEQLDIPTATVAMTAVSECATTIGVGGLQLVAVLNVPAGKFTR